MHSSVLCDDVHSNKDDIDKVYERDCRQIVIDDVPVGWLSTVTSYARGLLPNTDQPPYVTLNIMCHFYDGPLMSGLNREKSSDLNDASIVEVAWLFSIQPNHESDFSQLVCFFSFDVGK